MEQTGDQFIGWYFVKVLECNQTIERLNLQKRNLSINEKMQFLQAVAGKDDLKLYI